MCRWIRVRMDMCRCKKGRVSEMKKLRWIALVLAMCFMVTGCFGPWAAESEMEEEEVEVEILPEFEEQEFALVDGISDILPLAEALAELAFGWGYMTEEEYALMAYEEEEGRWRGRRGMDVVNFNGEAEALERLIGGSAEIMLVDRRPTEEAIARVKEEAFVRAVLAAPYGAYVPDEYADIELEFVPIATDALVFLTGRGNPVNDLTTYQVREIYSGRVTMWRVIEPVIEGRGDWPIRALQAPVESVSMRVMERLMGGERLMQPPSMFLVNPGAEPRLIGPTRFDSERDALIFTMFSHASRMLMDERTKWLSLDGVMPDVDTIRREQYGALVTYYAVIRADSEEESFARRFLELALTDAGQKAILRAGFVSVREVVLYEPVEDEVEEG